MESQLFMNSHSRSLTPSSFDGRISNRHGRSAWQSECKLGLCRHRLRRIIPQANLMSKLFGGDGPDNRDNKSRPVVIGSQNTANPEFPPYTVVKRGPVYDLRLYDAYPVVEMKYGKREEGYGALGAYIDGDNADGTRFAYGQPIIMRYYPSGEKVMQMLLGTRQLSDGSVKPREKSAVEALSALPAPKPPNRWGVSVSVAGGELVAVLRFDGYITPTTADLARQNLMKALETDGVKLADEEADGFFRCAQYGAVYQPTARLNEMMLRVKA